MEHDNDLSSTIIAKSDQLNADEIVDPITIVVSRVDKVGEKDQPVHIHSAGLQPFKPCLTMRRMLIAAWGKYKDEWIGRSMVLYCDPEVLWAGKEQGGVRVSHVSHIDSPVSKMLSVARGRKKLFTLLPIETEGRVTKAKESPMFELDDNALAWVEILKSRPERAGEIKDPRYRAFIIEASKK